MFKYIQKFLRRKIDKDSQSKSLLGTQAEVNKFGEFYMNHSENLGVVGAFLVHSFVSKNNFTPEELAAYKKAVADYAEVFRKAAAERKSDLELVKKDTVSVKDML
jgi:hypothetical protein